MIDIEVEEEELSDCEIDSLKAYLADIHVISQHLLSKDEEYKLTTLAQQGDISAWCKLIESNVKLVLKYARAYTVPGIDFLDLVQEGNIGLMHAIKKFDPAKGYRFSTYATWWIRQAMGRASAEKSRLIHIPVHVVENLYRIHRVTRKLFQDLGREPEPSEVAEACGMKVQAYQELVRIADTPISIDAPLDSIGNNTALYDAWTIADTLEDKTVLQGEDIAIDADARLRIDAMMCVLNESEFQVIRLRYGLDDGKPHSLKECASLVHGLDGHLISYERIRQIEVAALRKMRNADLQSEA